MYQFEKLDKKLLGEQIEDELLNFILQEPLNVGQRIPNEFELAEKNAMAAPLQKRILSVRRASLSELTEALPSCAEIWHRKAP